MTFFIAAKTLMRRTAMHHRRFLIAVFLSTPCWVSVAYAGEPATVTVQQAAALSSRQQAVIVDVRDDAEWQQARIPGAIHIPLGQLAGRMSELHQYKNRTLITQCRSGKRSLEAAKMLKQAGFSPVYSLDGGFFAWQKAGLPSQ